MQEGLKGLKQEWGSELRLKKATAASSTDAPFPVSLVLHPEPPDACSLFDQLEGLTLRATIHKQLLAMSDGGAPAPIWQALSLAVESVQLPSCLCRAMTAQLRQKLASTAPSFCGGAAVVRIVLEVVNKSFSMLLSDLPELLTVKPELLESYESVGATGNSERRIKFTLSSNENDLDTIDEAPSTDASQVQAIADIGAAEEKPVVSCSTDEPQLHPNIQKMLKLMAARFPDLQSTHQSTCAASSDHHGASDAGPDVSETPFTVSITPSDASWLHGSIKCLGTVALSASSSERSEDTSNLPSESSVNIKSPSSEAVMAQQHSTPAVGEATKSNGGESHSGKGRAPRRACVPAGQAAGPCMDVTLAVEPGPIIDVPTCAIVNHMLTKEAQCASGSFRQ